MNYEFPIIERIDDILKAIEGRPEFIVAERENYVVVNYMVSMPTSFEMEDENDYYGALRRECRGIIFALDGTLLSRPYHKFFNLNEKDETQIFVVDFEREHEILEKMDGSMIRPLIIDGVVRLATKMGLTDIAEEAEKLLTEEQKEWLVDMVQNKKTPLFEYIAPTNKIVIDYKEAELILTSVRDNLTGEYTLKVDSPFKKVPAYGTLDGNINDYVARQVKMEGREGDIIRFSNGHMLKLKNEWYCRIHKTKDLIRAERNILDIIINEQMDDVLPMLDETDLKTVQVFEETFWETFNGKLGQLEGLVDLAKVLAGNDKKKLALEFVPNLKDRTDGRFLFAAYDGKNLRELMIEKVKASVGNTTKYDELMKWMEN